MDSRSWPWRRRSSERVTGMFGSSESSPAHSASYSDDQDASKAASDHLQMSEEAMMAWQLSEEKLRSLNEKLSQALLDNTAKDSLVEKHTKVAEEAVSGWEEAKKEAMALKEQFDVVTQQKLALEDRVCHLDDALKECMRELRHVREEQEQKIHEAVVEKTREWDKVKFELDTRIAELEQLLSESKMKNNTMSTNLQESSKALSDIRESRNQAEAEAKVLRMKLETLDGENSALKNKLHALSKEVNMIIEERDVSKKSAQAANKQHLETVKKVTKLEAECQRLRGLVRKRLPGSAALAQMKSEVETVGKDSGEVKLKRSHSKGAGSPHSSVVSSNDKQHEHAQKENEYLTERLMAMEEETQVLKDTLSKRNSELKASRVMCARTAAKLSSVEQQLESLMQKQEKPAFELHFEGSRSGSTSNPPSLASISEDGNDGEPCCAETWASALIAELDQFKKGKVSGKVEKLSDLPKVDLMDDFLEMEKLASMPSTRLDHTGLGKLDDFTEKNVGAHLGALSIQEDRASLEEALAQKELKLQDINKECSDLLKKLTSAQEKLTALQARNNWNESALVNLQEKLDIILEAEAEGADLHKVLDDIKCAKALATESETDSHVGVRPCLKNTERRVSNSDVEFATTAVNVVNFLQCITQKMQKSEKFKASDVDKLDYRILEFAQLVDKVLQCKANITELIAELISFLSQFRKMFVHSSSENCQSYVTDFENQAPDLIQSSLLNDGIGTDGLSTRESSHGLSGEEIAHRLCFPLAGGSFHIIRKLNSIRVEKASLESELKDQVSRCGHLEEDLLHFTSENANLETFLAIAKDELEHTQCQLAKSEEELMHFKSENADLEKLLVTTEEKLEYTECHVNQLEEKLIHFKSQNGNLETNLAVTKEKLEHVKDQHTKTEEDLMHFKNENANLETALAETKEKLERIKDQHTKTEENLMHFKSENVNLETVLAETKEKLEHIKGQHTETEEDLMHFKSENVNLKTVLAATKEKLEQTQYQLTESEKMLASLEAQLGSAKESKESSENELAAMTSHKLDIESQLKVTEIEMKGLFEKVEALESELWEERNHRKDAMDKCKMLQEQLERKEQGSEDSKYLVAEEEIRKRQERDIAAAAGKLAECQETILVLSRHLKALATPVDPLEFPYDGEKRTERDQRFELDAPWSPHSQTASSTSEIENLSILTGREIRGRWPSESVTIASDFYRGNTHDRPTPADYMDGQFSLSDTEESSPTRSSIKSCTHRNSTPFLEGSKFTMPVKVNGGESPISTSSSSSTSTFFSKAQE